MPKYIPLLATASIVLGSATFAQDKDDQIFVNANGSLKTIVNVGTELEDKLAKTGQFEVDQSFPDRTIKIVDRPGTVIIQVYDRDTDN